MTAAPSELRVDCHAHVLAVDRPLIAERHSAPARDATLAQCLESLDRHGMARGVLTAPSFYGDDNSLLLEALARAPDRLRGTVIVKPGISRSALAVMAQRNVVGLRLNWVRRATLPDVTTPEFQDLFRAIRELDWHIEIYLEGPKLAHVLPLIQAMEVKIVIDHFGEPDPQQQVNDPGFQTVLRAVGAGRTWVKLSGYYRLGGADPRPYAESLLRAGGPERLVWGSDWPWVGHEQERSYQDCLDRLADWVVDPQARRVILCDAPAALFKFPPSAAAAGEAPEVAR